MYNRIDVPVSCKDPFTDYSRWRLLVNDGGRHTWHYLQTDEECAEWPQNTVDKFWLGLPTVSSSFYSRKMILMSCRTCQNYLVQKTRSMLRRMGTHSTRIFSLMTAIGLENTEDLCFFFLDWSLARTLLGCHLPMQNVVK